MGFFSSTTTITSEKGDLIAIIPYDENYFTSLIHMYDRYDPLVVSRGSPHGIEAGDTNGPRM